MDMVPHLMPCPFCGGKAIFKEQQTYFANDETEYFKPDRSTPVEIKFRITCAKCGCSSHKSGGSIVICMRRDGAIHVLRDDRTISDEEWNERIAAETSL